MTVHTYRVKKLTDSIFTVDNQIAYPKSKCIKEAIYTVYTHKNLELWIDEQTGAKRVFEICNLKTEIINNTEIKHYTSKTPVQLDRFPFITIYDRVVTTKIYTYATFDIVCETAEGTEIVYLQNQVA